MSPDVLDRMVAYEECKAAFYIDADLEQLMAKLDAGINEGLSKFGIRDVKAAREAMRFTIARIVAARKSAIESIKELVIAEDAALEQPEPGAND